MARMMIRHSITQACWFLGFFTSLCFAVYTMTTNSEKAADCKPPKDCPRTKNCHFGVVFHLNMNAWVGIAAASFFLASLGMWWAAATLDAADDVGRSDEEYIHNCARDKHRKADEAADMASDALKLADLGLDAAKISVAQDCLKLRLVARNRAAKLMEETKPREGMARVEWRKFTRFIYLCSMLCIMVLGLSVNIAFYLALELQHGCDKTATELAIHYSCAICHVLVTGRFLRIGVISD